MPVIDRDDGEQYLTLEPVLIEALGGRSCWWRRGRRRGRQKKWARSTSQISARGFHDQFLISTAALRKCAWEVLVPPNFMFCEEIRLLFPI